MSSEPPSKAAPMCAAPFDAEREYRSLTERVRETSEAGVAIPCLGPDSSRWTSDDPAEQLAAAELCQTCPLAAQCRSYAVSAGETSGVWGGWIADAAARSARTRLTTLEQRRVGSARRRASRAQARDCGHVVPAVFLEGANNNSRSEGTFVMTTTQPGTCHCGCRESTSARANYRPGHDSRHLSRAVERLVVEAEQGRRVGARQIASASKEMPSEALRAKFTERAARAVRAVRAQQRLAGGAE